MIIRRIGLTLALAAVLVLDVTTGHVDRLDPISRDIV